MKDIQKGKKKFHFKISDTKYIAMLQQHLGSLEVGSITPCFGLTVNGTQFKDLPQLIKRLKEQPNYLSYPIDYALTLETNEFELTSELIQILPEFCHQVSGLAACDLFQIHRSMTSQEEREEEDCIQSTTMPILLKDITGIAALSGFFYLCGFSVPEIVISDCASLALYQFARSRLLNMGNQKAEALKRSDTPLSEKEQEAFEAGVDAAQSTGYFTAWKKRASYSNYEWYIAGKYLAEHHQQADIDKIKKRRSSAQ